MNKILASSVVALLFFGSIQDTLGYGRGSASSTSSSSNSSSGSSIISGVTVPTAADASVVAKFSATKLALQSAFTSPGTLATWLENYCKLVGRKKSPLTEQKISSDEAKQLRLWVNFLKVAGNTTKSPKKLEALKKTWKNSSISAGALTEFVMPYIADSLQTVANLDVSAKEAYIIAKAVIQNDKEVSKSK